MFPQPSSWMSPEEGSAWFFRITPTRQVCSTTGWDGLLDIQSALRDRLATMGPLPTWDGSMVSDRDVPDGGSWNVPLLRALYAVAQNDLRVPANIRTGYLNDVRASSDIAQRLIGEKTLALALWVAYVSHSFAADGSDVFGNGSPAQVTFPDGGVELPPRSVPVPRPSRDPSLIVAGVRCTQPEALPGGVFFTPTKILVAGLIGAGVLGMLSLSKHVVTRKERR